MWHYWAEEWALAEKVSFNGTARHITVNAGVTAIDIAADVYSAWKRWCLREPQYLPAMRYSGYDPIPGGFTGATYFAINGWKLCYNATAVSVSGALYSEDYGTAFWSLDGVSPVYPATVSSLVSSTVVTQNIITGDLASVPAAVRAELAAELARIDKPISTRATPGDVFAAL